MKQQSKKYLLLILLIAVLVAPSFALAAWWNPMSWGIWNKIFNKQPPTQQQTNQTKTPADESWEMYVNPQYGFEIAHPNNIPCSIDVVNASLPRKGINFFDNPGCYKRSNDNKNLSKDFYQIKINNIEWNSYYFVCGTDAVRPLSFVAYKDGLFILVTINSNKLEEIKSILSTFKFTK